MREEFTNEMSDLLTTGAERLGSADLDYEGAMLLALTTRRDLAATTLSLAAEADKTVLRLVWSADRIGWRARSTGRSGPAF